MPALIDRIGRWLPHGYGDAARQLSLFVVAELCYEAVRGIADGARMTAMANGQHVIDFERSIHTFFEPNLQAIFLSHRWIIDFANFMYMNSHFVVTTAFLVWLYLFRNETYYFVRNMFIASMGIALIGYSLYPTAPPRMYPQYGFVDTLNAFAGVNHDSALAKSFINPYAAVPSMHCAFAMMIGVSGVMVCRHWWSKAWWAFWPILIAWVVIVTGNHYWVDWALGWMVAVVAALIASRVLARARPEVWSFRPKGAREIEV